MIATGRSIIPAGCGLVLAMLVAAQVLPSAVISSVALAVIVASVLSVLSAIFTTPSILMRARQEPRSLVAAAGASARTGLALGWTQRLSRRPAMVLGVVFALFLCAAWALTLQTRHRRRRRAAPTTRVGSSTKTSSTTLGAGLGRPAGSDDERPIDGPVTTPKRLAALTNFQHRVEADPGVATMAGFASSTAPPGSSPARARP